MLILIDNYDSFTYNLVQYFGELGADIRVFRNDQVTLDELIALNPSHLVISPGPGEPIADGGISADAMRHFTGVIPSWASASATSAWAQSTAGQSPAPRA
jgi:anthranilate/para-aminobenzoate synthase component II